MEAGEILLRRGLLNQRQLDLSRSAQADGVRLDQIAVDLGFLTEEAALRALGEEVGIDYVDLADSTVKIDTTLLTNFPQKLMHRQTLFPLRRDNGSLIVATSDPFDLYPLDEISAATGLSVIPVLANRSEIGRLIKSHMGVGSDTIADMVLAKKQEGDVELLSDIESDGSEISEQAQEASVVKLVNEILLEAVETRTSDVHLESQGTGLRIRYRIDGNLQSQPIRPEINRFQAAIISRLKIMSRMNIAEKRLPQDGRIKLKVAGREVDVRVSVIPMLHGEGIVLRILDKGRMKFDLRGLGMEEGDYRLFKELITLPHGIILVTGPTGSGKTTTLYSALLEIRDESTKIITTEDPVEYQLDGINQIQVHAKIGFTFGASLRSILRHDPDIVLVGEIRDLETAENAIQASLTGHLVFSTLHTNDAAGAFTRMIDMGVEPFLVASTVEGVMAQRLVRLLCPSCKKQYRPKKEDLPPDFPWEDLEKAGGMLFEPVGCRNCRQTGFAGRQAIVELMVTTDEVRALVHERKGTWAIKQSALKEGMKTLRKDGWVKAITGRTTIQEVIQTARSDDVISMH